MRSRPLPQVLLLLACCASWAAALWPFSAAPPRHRSRIPDPRLVRAPSGSTPEKKKAMADLLDKYAPVFKLA